MNSLLFGIALLATPATDTVTLEMMAKPVGEVVAEVARQTQLPITADVSTASRPVFIAVDKMPVKVFLERLAKITDCEWHARGASSVLTRGNRAQIARQVEMSERILRARQGLDWLKYTLTQGSITTQQGYDNLLSRASTLSSGEVDGVAESILLEFVHNVPISELVRFSEPEHLVYSSHPNALQRPLPYTPQSPGRAQQVRRDLHTRLHRSVTREALDERFPPIHKFTIRVIGHESTPELLLTLYGPSGNVIRARLSSFSVVGGHLVPDLPAFADSKVDLSRDSREFVATKFSAPNPWTASTPRIGKTEFEHRAPARLVDRMRRPTQFDPTNFVIVDLLKAWHTKSGTSLMASVSDDLLLDLFADAADHGALPLKSLAMYGRHILVSDQHGWMMRPTSWARADRQMVDRVALEAYLTEPTLENLVRLGANAWEGVTLTRAYLARLDPFGYWIISERSYLLRFLRDFPGAMRELRGNWQMEALSPNRQRAAVRLFLDQCIRTNSVFERSRGEPTELYSGNVGWRITLSQLDDERLARLLESQPAEILKPETLGYMSSIGSAPTSIGPLSIVKFSELVIDVVVGTHHNTEEIWLRDPKWKPVSRTLEELPETLRNRFATGRDQARQERLNRKGDGLPPVPQDTR